MVITAITQQKHDPRRFSVFIDGEFRLGLSGEDVLFYRLNEGGAITEAELAKLITEGEFAKARDAAIKYIGYRAKSAKAVRDKLAEKGYGRDGVERVMALLIEGGYINDVDYAVNYIKEASAKHGRRRIEADLAVRGISKADIAAAYEQLSGDEPPQEVLAARSALIKRYGEIPDTADFAESRRVWGFLMRRGFSSDVIREALKDEE